MRISKRASKIAILFLLFFMAAALAIAGLIDKRGHVFTAFERAFYLTDQQTVFIRPGLQVTIQAVTIPTDLKPLVTFLVTDSQGQPLDRTGVLTPGVVASSFILAYLPPTTDGSIPAYVDYSTSKVTSPITGITTYQATTASGGTYSSLGNGVYTYKFVAALPSNYNRAATHTLGIYATRDLTQYGLSLYVSDVTYDFVPNGSPVTQVRQIVSTANCNQCHDPLSAHGTTGRQDVRICILCHNPQTIDPDTNRTVDMKVFIHKIHMGSSLPSVQAGTPYQIIGYNQAVSDFSDVVFPQDIRNCQTCHKGTAQTNAWMLFPSIEACGSCHDDVNFATGANHPGGAYSDSSQCASCHQPQGQYEYDASISGAHTVPYKSNQLLYPKMTVLSITNTAPGQSPTVQFTLTDKNANNLNPAIFAGSTGRLSANIGGPTTDYTTTLSETISGASYSNGVATYTFKTKIPSGATGTYAMEFEGYVNTTVVQGGNVKSTFVQRDAIDNVVKYFAVTGSTVVPRRTVVSIANCNVCHDKLQPHGGNRNQVEACDVCHNPTATDASLRPASALPPEAIDLQILVHKIHTGANLTNGYTVYGFGGSTNNFADVQFPGDRRDCVKCHVGTSYTVPLPAGVQPAVTPRNYWTPTPPISAACLACHDDVSSAAHAFLNIATFGTLQTEACPVCHQEGADFAVTQVHAR
jgi:OmcA/MtrC family decaheme c-type cytochrome